MLVTDRGITVQGNWNYITKTTLLNITYVSIKCVILYLHEKGFFTEKTQRTFSSRSLICLLWISVLSSRSRILCKYSERK